MVEVFKTNIISEREAAYILKRLNRAFPNCKINFDLEDCDNILRLQSESKDFDINPVITLVRRHGFEIEILTDEIPEEKKNLLGKIRLYVCILTVSIISALGSCSASKQTACIDESKINDGPCVFDYNPVCGCDGKTYGNPCEAERSGVTSWNQGECETKSR